MHKAVWLNIANNRIGKTGAIIILNTLQEKDCKLINLNLEGNLLGNGVCKTLLEKIAIYGGIKILNLSKNELDD